MDRLTRHELKTDRFVEEVGQTVHFLEEHRQAVIRYGSIVLAILILVGAGYAWMRVKKAERQSALSAVLEIYNAPVMDPPPADLKAFRTEQEKNDAIVKACNELVQKYAGSNEAAIASYLLGTRAADQGDLAAAERYLKDASEKADREYASLAMLALAQLYERNGRPAEAEKLLRGLVAKPTVLVTKEQAELELARVLMKSKPEEARRIVTPLINRPGPVGRISATLLAQIPSQQGK
ncbi:MAG: tetratricopeptide repeat protein [Bryobacteraceae bacterium]|nr:tetratricopeptide repeat protein [Bryobacteraceae bacterium]